MKFLILITILSIAFAIAEGKLKEFIINIIMFLIDLLMQEMDENVKMWGVILELSVKDTAKAGPLIVFKESL